jgi:protease IV
MDDNFTTPPTPPTPPPEPSPATPQQPPPLRQTPPPAFTQPIYVQTPRARSGRGWKIFALLMLVLFLCSLVFNPFQFLFSMMKGEPRLQVHHTTAPRLQEAWIKDENSRHKIAVIPIEGVITSQSMGRGGNTMVEIVEEQFRRAADDKNVKAVVLKVNSPGGEVLASDDIYSIIWRFQEKTSKPVVAAMGSLAASGGYYVSAPCQWIVANEMTITGSIGVIMHGYNFRGLMDKVGIRPEVFKSGKYKDMLSFDKREEDITQEERDMIQSMVNETFDRFKTIVSEGRAGAAKKNVGATEFGKTLAENWQQYADGRILSGKEALQHGFIDELGNFEAAITRARKLAKIPDANVVEYQPLFDLGDLFGIFGQGGEARTLKIDVGLDTLKLQTGRLYFLCPLVLPR